MTTPKELLDWASRQGESENLTSDYREPPSEVKLARTPARELQQRAFDGDIPRLDRLPMFGDTTKSPFVRLWSIMLTAYPKTGKTEALARWTDEWSRLGLKVGYYTEEPESVWIARLSTLPGGFENVDLIYAMGASMDAILGDIQRSRYDIIVIDTIRLLRIADESDNSAINIALTPFIAICRHLKMTLIMAHHTRKGSGLHGEAAAGGHAFLGIVDVALELHRDEQSPKRRIIRGWGRVFEVSDQMYELQHDGTMKLLGDPKELELEQVAERVKEIVLGEWTKTSQIRDALEEPKPSADQVGKALTTLAELGIIERDPPIIDGRQQGKRYKWRDSNLTSDARSLIGGSEVSEPEKPDLLEVS